MKTVIVIILFIFSLMSGSLYAKKCDTSREKLLKELNIQKEITQQALTKSYLAEALRYRDKNQILKYKHLLAKAIDNSGSLDAKMMYFNTLYGTGELKEYRFISSNRDIPTNQRYRYDYNQSESNGSLIEHNITIHDTNGSPYLWQVLAIEILEIEIIEENKIMVNYRDDSNTSDNLYNSKIKVLDISSKQELNLTKESNRYILDGIKKFRVFDFKWYRINPSVAFNMDDRDYYNMKFYTQYDYDIALSPYVLDDERESIKIEKYRGDIVDSNYTINGYSIGSNPLYPLIIPKLEIVILSGYDISNSNFGGDNLLCRWSYPSKR